MFGALFLAGSLFGAWLTINALRPLASRGIGPLWMPAVVIGEMPLHHMAWQAVLTGLIN